MKIIQFNKRTSLVFFLPEYKYIKRTHIKTLDIDLNTYLTYYEGTIPPFQFKNDKFKELVIHLFIFGFGIRFETVFKTRR